MSRRVRHRWKLRAGALTAAATIAVVAHLPHSPLDIPGDGPSLPSPDWSPGGARPVQPASEQTWPRLEPPCDPPPADAPRPSVEQLNEIVSRMDLRYGQAGDIGASGRLGDDRLVFVFGDTLREPDVTPNIVANSLLVMSGTCASQLLTREHGPVIPDRGDGVVHWPTTLAVLPGEEGDRLVVFTSRIRREGGNALAFTYLGSSATLFEVPHGGTPRRVDTLELTPDDPDPHQINWGGAAMVLGEHLYVYGTQATGTGRTLYVARAPVAGVAERSTWRFWDGATWQRDPDAAVRILAPDDPGVSQAFSASVVDDRVVLVSKGGGDLGDHIYAWTSGSPTGPWTRRRGPSATFKDSQGELMYAPVAHPEIPIASGELLVGVSRNPEDLGDLVANPRLGRPWFTQIAPFGGPGG